MVPYTPTEPSLITTVEDALQFIIEEHRKIAVAFSACLPQQLEELHAVPSRVKDYMIVAADGTDWNPGSGQGIYAYYNAGWHFLG